MRSLAILLLLALPLAAAGAVAADAGSNNTPNVVLILADDLDWADIGRHGSLTPTPAIDGIFREGVELDTLLVSPLCSPTRAALLTGRHPARVGLGGRNAMRLVSTALAPEEVTIAEAFQASGYATGAFGKWHLGDREEPQRNGFDEFCGVVLAAGGTITGMLAVEDLAPTLLALAGITRPAGPPLDGRDVSAYMTAVPAASRLAARGRSLDGRVAGAMGFRPACGVLASSGQAPTWRRSRSAAPTLEARRRR